MNKAPHIVFSIINDVRHDRRMFRIAETLTQAGYRVTIIGRSIPGNYYPKDEKSFGIKRLPVPFKEGKGMYVFFNLYLLLVLLFSKADALGAVDLDTLLSNRIVGWLRRKPVVYDAHELFTEVPELLGRKEQKIWSWLEAKLLPGVQYAYTVGQAIAAFYTKKYNVPFDVIRNVPLIQTDLPPVVKNNNFTVVYVGMLNAGRGLNWLFEAVKGTNIQVVLCGTGVELEPLKQLANHLNITEQVTFLGHVSPEEMPLVLRRAHLGYCVLASESLSYYYSLANKFYDYIHAAIPQIVSDFPEYSAVLAQFKTGVTVENNPDAIRKALLLFQQNKEVYAQCKAACVEAQKVYNWQNEQQKVLNIYRRVISV